MERLGELVREWIRELVTELILILTLLHSDCLSYTSLLVNSHTDSLAVSLTLLFSSLIPLVGDLVTELIAVFITELVREESS